jgi:hypothetical protein
MGGWKEEDIAWFIVSIGSLPMAMRSNFDA